MHDFSNKISNIIGMSLNEKRMEVKVTSLINKFKDVIDSIKEEVNYGRF